jgi:hypothetical protein
MREQKCVASVRDERKTSLGRPRRRLEDDIKVYGRAGIGFIWLRISTRTLMKMVIDLRVP